MSEVRLIEVPEDYAGQRLDNFLLARLKGVPKSMIYRVIRKGEVRVNKGRAKPDRKLESGDIVRVPPIRVTETVTVTPSQGLINTLDKAVIHDDKGLLIINKPSGLAVHGGSGINIGLIEALRQAYKAPFLELVHRLDRDTSGCVMVARKRSVLKHLQEALRHKGVIQKRYLAVVNGHWPKHMTVVDVPLKRCEYPNGERVVRVHDEGKASVTHFKVIQYFEGCTLIAAKPLTGRTHQIRVHALHAGHPLVGDDKYTPPELNKAMRGQGFKRLCLHAHNLDLTLADKTPVSVMADLPIEIAAPLKKMGLEAFDVRYF
ncbi:RluA family pseudouridine synthase [Marinagarivorans algicola]|uniref:RluA family pseudouridine synthase n=1 Tax=Marinagarivorans algicola TaxID=1513270 RepID=UPI0006B9295E|nr:RluA family pseudouridine synthase [Marinagarivorans algicola]